MEIIYLLFIVLLAAFLGFELIRKVPYVSGSIGSLG